MKPGLLLIGGATERMMERMHADFTVHPLPDDLPAFLASHGADIIAVATNGHDGVRPEIMDGLPNLKVISCYGVGYDAIDTAKAAERGILVSHTPGVLNDEVANTAIMLWLAVSRNLVTLDQYVRAGRWAREGNPALTRSVQDRTVGILGLGRIGQAIADRAAMFNAKVVYHSRSKKDVPYDYYDDLTAMAAASDVLVVITPGGPETKALVNVDVLNALGPNGILINVARGSVVDEAALVSALQEGRLGGAGLDVFEAEPVVPDALWGMENVVLLPHVGSATVETRQAMGDLTVDNLAEFLAKGTVLTSVPETAHLA